MAKYIFLSFQVVAVTKRNPDKQKRWNGYVRRGLTQKEAVVQVLETCCGMYSGTTLVALVR